MKLRFPAPRRALTWLAVLCLALPAAALYQRLAILFEANFDVAGAPGGGSLPAQVGQFNVPSQPAEFSVVPGDGGGQLKIEDNGTTAAAVLEAQFKKLFVGQDLLLEWSVQPMQSGAKLVVSAQDAGDTGLIDCTMDDDGTVDVGGMDTGYTYAAGNVYRFHLLLKDPLAGNGSWTLDIESPGLPPFEATGAFDAGVLFTGKSMRFTRPANEGPGKFLVDDIRVSTQSYSANW